MQLKLSVPSKTFLFGEYLALRGGLCATVQTEPRFELELRDGGEGRCGGIHPHSLAGHCVRENSGEFGQWDMEFRDPHQGQGGFGASSAQFVLTYMAAQVLRHKVKDLRSLIHADKLWSEFRQLAQREQKGLPPSGADVVGQLVGGVSRFSFQPFQVRSQNWPFPHLNFMLLRTGKKLATHSHLEALEGRTFQGLLEPVNRASEALKTGSEELFLSALQAVARALEKEQLVAEHSLELLGELRQRPEILVSKGCGALGADTLLALYRPQDQEAVEVIVEALGLETVASREQVSSGLKINLDWQGEREERMNLAPEMFSPKL